jgi:phosphatidylethanolamine-binding protein (PEBP) family uncharacterized protein
MRFSLTPPLLTTALALAVAGCGSSTEIDVPKIPFRSAAIAAQRIPATYTCDGKNILPPLEWGSVPPHTRELVLFIIGIEPQGPERFSVRAEWALAGVNPKLHRIVAGKLPPGAFPGFSERGSTKYSLCPPKGISEQYQFELYGITKAKVPRRFIDEQALSVLNVSNRRSPASAHGSFDAVYRRP